MNQSRRNETFDNATVLLRVFKKDFSFRRFRGEMQTKESWTIAHYYLDMIVFVRRSIDVQFKISINCDIRISGSFLKFNVMRHSGSKDLNVPWIECYM